MSVRDEGITIASQRTARPPGNVADVLAVVERSLEDDKADDMRVIALSGKADFADYMVVASGTSMRRVGAMASHLIERLKHSGMRGLAAEGRGANDWVLIDAGAVVVHIFRPDIRAYYDLEKLWESERDLPAIG